MVTRSVYNQRRFDSFHRGQEYAIVAQLVELEPAHGKGPNAAGKTRPMVRVHPVAPSFVSVSKRKTRWEDSSKVDPV